MHIRALAATVIVVQQEYELAEVSCRRIFDVQGVMADEKGLRVVH